MDGRAGERRTWLLVLGVALIVAGLVAAVGLWVAAGRRLDDAVRSLARAPVDCDTTLDFSRTGEFLIFVETRGELAGVRGDCDKSGSYDYQGDDPPSVVLTMVDPDGGVVELPLRTGVGYDAAGFAGRSERAVDITTTGDHVLTVQSADSSFAIAVGKNPHDGVGLLRAGAVVAGLLGIGAGIVCVVLAARRRGATPAHPAGWPAAWPASPPGGPAPGQFPPAGPPQGWPARPPTMPPPARPPSAPPASGPAGPPSWPPQPAPGQPGPAPGRPGTPGTPQPTPGQPPTPGWPPQPTVPGQPPTPGAPGSRPGDGGRGDGSTGDGERSPWAPPHDG